MTAKTLKDSNAEKDSGKTLYGILDENFLRRMIEELGKNKLKPGRKVNYPKPLVAKLKSLPYYTDLASCGTTHCHYLSILAKVVKLVATDGVSIMCERLKCYWVIDLLAALKPRFWDTFYVAYVVRTEDGGFYLMLDDGNRNIMYCEKYPYTDIKQDLKLYLAPGEDMWVLMLPSEY